MRFYVVNSKGEKLYVNEGDDVSQFLHIVKWEPEIPASMSGDLQSIGSEWIPKYDIENVKKYPHVLTTDRVYYITEKLHGTFCVVGHIPEFNPVDETNKYPDPYIVASKGLGAKGLVFKDTAENNEKNLYKRVAKEQNVYGMVDKIRQRLNTTLPVYLFGEIFGKGVQDLHYGLQKPQFRAFDIFVGKPATGHFVDSWFKFGLFETLDIPHVPLLKVSHMDSIHSDIAKLTQGQTIFDGHNVREGIVITPEFESQDPEIGRVILKSVSEDYLSRKGGTEYN